MGDSDRVYFAWLRSTLLRFERQTKGRLSALSYPTAFTRIGALAEQGLTPPLQALFGLMQGPGVRVTYFDKYPVSAAVSRLDLDRPDGLGERAYDLLTAFRVSYLLQAPERFLHRAGLALVPGGLLLIDWLHGAADRPTVGVQGAHVYPDGGSPVRVPFQTTYWDPEFGREPEVRAFLAHLNRPPRRWRIGPRVAPVPLLPLTPETYGLELAQSVRNPLGPAHLEAAGFALAGRAAGYFYPQTRQFPLYLLTILRKR